VGTAGALELDPVAIMVVDGGCARAAAFGEEERCSDDVGVEELPVTTAPLT
jgi:hypothetical protein